jgi:hypothetical protein
LTVFVKDDLSILVQVEIQFSFLKFVLMDPGAPHPSFPPHYYPYAPSFSPYSQQIQDPQAIIHFRDTFLQPDLSTLEKYVSKEILEEISKEKSKGKMGLRKTKMCSHFERTGNCPYAENCNYAHDQSEIINNQ